MKNRIKLIVMTILVMVFMMVFTYRTMENHWAKNDLANLVGNFESSELLDKNDGVEVWRITQYETDYIIKIENGNLISKIEL